MRRHEKWEIRRSGKCELKIKMWETEMRDSELEIWNEKCKMRNSKCEMLN